MFSYLYTQEEELKTRFNHARNFNDLEDCACAILEFVDYASSISPEFTAAYQEWDGNDEELLYNRPVCSREEAERIVEVAKGEGFLRLVTPYFNMKFFSLVSGMQKTSFDGSYAVYELN